MTYQLGIDLGTTYTAAAVRAANDQIEIITLGSRAGAVPSVVLVREDGSLLFGETAAHRGMTEPDRVIREFKRRVGDNRSVRAGGMEITADEVMAHFLRWVVDKVAERRGGAPNRIVLAHPANWGTHKMEALRGIVTNAGVGPVDLVTEPLAAAIRYATEARVADGALVAVYDLGGGTFDATVMRKEGDGFAVLGNPEGIEYLGGVDFDEALRHRVKTLLGDSYLAAEGQPGFDSAAAALDRDIRDAKEALSNEEAVSIPVLLPGASTNIDITRVDYEAMIRPSIEESVAGMRRCLRNAGVAPEEIDHFLLVGGSSRTPLVGQLLSHEFGLEMSRDTDPKYAVAEGAAIFTQLAATAAPVTPAPVAPAPDPRATTAAASPMGVPAASVTPEPVPMQPQPVAQDPAAAAPFAPSAQPQPTPAPVPSEAHTDVGAGAGSGLRTRDLLLGAALLLIIVAAGATFILTRGDSDEPAEIASNTDENIGQVLGAAESQVEVTGAGQLVAPEIPSAENMVEIGAGSYTVGLDDSEGHVPFREVSLDTFWIDAFEVTNAAYSPLVVRGEVTAPLGWNANEIPPGLEAHPVFGVTHADAEAFCGSLGKRLPTESEWEAAARGGAARWYPWGNDPDAVELPDSGTHQVGSIAATSTPEGVFDMSGNVWEWVGEPYEPMAANEALLRGGANGNVADLAFRQVGDAADEEFVRLGGFRCASTEVDVRDGTTAVAVEDLQQAGSATVDGLLVDSFDDPASGWPVEEGSNYVRGYHPPDFYHVEAQGNNERVLAPRGVNFADVEVSTTVLVDHTDTDVGSYRYGLLFRAEGVDYYAFTINPVDKRWAVIHDDSLGFREIASGSTDDGYGITGRDQLTVRLEGPTMTFLINDEVVAELDTEGYHLQGDIGFFVENFDQTLSHVHFDEIAIKDL